MISQSKHSNTAIIAIGSNMGDKMENSRRGIAALEAPGELTLVSQSDFYLTEPVGYADQPWFVNCAVMVKTGLVPGDLLQFLKNWSMTWAGATAESEMVRGCLILILYSTMTG